MKILAMEYNIIKKFFKFELSIKEVKESKRKKI
jgi:hypothetical protein